MSDASKTVVNVKGVRQQAWDAARRSAIQANDTMGEWLSEAIDCRIARDSGSVKVDNPPMTHDQITARMTALAALQQSAAVAKQTRVRNPALKAAMTSLESAIMQTAQPRARLISGKFGADSGKERQIPGQSSDWVAADLRNPDADA
jgi:hypothetical protein